uniref:Ryanodineinositol 1 putative n=1 Tax=Albugo laibachii Nc14 TaxID=890382 RepID=F0W1Y2_9STRA|nr:ryanodineinositol 1 putative [Albugo laibachii Nc14]|eukprot:CCA15061.1 ryanodineinositol 1 putative [Albugo laibachii Nc14]
MRVYMRRVQLCMEQEKRKQFYKELVIYFGFLIILLWVLLSTLPVYYPNGQNNVLQNLFFKQPFPNVTYPMTFSDVTQESEIWEWVQGVLLPGFYASNLRNYKVIGSMMLRTGRVNGRLCKQLNGDSWLLFENELCYPEFTLAQQAKESYGKRRAPKQFEWYTWRSDLPKLISSQTTNPFIVNRRRSYGTGGYAIYLPRDNATVGKLITDQLEKYLLIDGSRYFMSSFTLYNPGSTFFSSVEALIEISTTENLEVSSRVRTFKIPRPIDTFVDFMRDNWPCLLLLMVTFGLLLREVRDLRETGCRRYLNSIWNILDILQLILLLCFFINWTVLLVWSINAYKELVGIVDEPQCNGVGVNQQQASQCFVSLQHIGLQAATLRNIGAALAFISVAIVFKYLRLNTRLNLLWRTLRFAAKDLLAFVVIFFTMFVAFAVMGFLTFGSTMQAYSTLSVSLTSSFQMLFGAFDYEQLYTANPAMAAFFFFSFMISIYLICVNMFIAIMTEYYSMAQAEKKAHEQNKNTHIIESEQGSADGNKLNDEEFTDSLVFMDIEYDIIKQLRQFWNGLHLRVRLLSRKEGYPPFATDKVAIFHSQQILLVDHDYLLAERKRLRQKFRACVHLVRACADFIRIVKPDFSLQMEPKTISDTRLASKGSSYTCDQTLFPVTFVPLSSQNANVIEVLSRLKPGMILDLDDGSFTKDQVSLQVLGDQPAFLRPLENDEEFIHVHSDQDQLYYQTYQNQKDRSFGLRYNHAHLGDSSHIRACRVIYRGETVLDGQEICLLPSLVWFRYFLGYMVWSSITNFLCYLVTPKHNKNRLISDAEVDLLIEKNFTAPGRGISCRFDELVRNFRLLITKKVHKKHLIIPDLEERICMEVITFLERFPSALTPIDKRELEGYKYTPQPVDTSHVRLPNSIHLLTELLSQHAHEVWAVGRISQGWQYGPHRDNAKKLHKDLVPYESLTEEDKQYDRDTSIEALKVITALGYVLEPPAKFLMESFGSTQFGVAASEESGTYEPKPIPTDDVIVPRHLRSLIELLAENTHEVWATMRMGQGWTYGPRCDDLKREHNGLVPYIYLTQEEKQMDRNTALQTVKIILKCGFTFTHRDRMTPNVRSRRNIAQHQDHLVDSARIFGRNENPQASNVSEAALIIRGANKAKHAFLDKSRQI